MVRSGIVLGIPATGIDVPFVVRWAAGSEVRPVLSVERDEGVMIDWKNALQLSKAVLNTSPKRRLASDRSVPDDLEARRAVSGVPCRAILAPTTEAEAEGVSPR
jgi:hypothetical protein